MCSGYDSADSLRRPGVMVIVMKLEAASRIPAGSIALDGDTVPRVEGEHGGEESVGSDQK